MVWPDRYGNDAPPPGQKPPLDPMQAPVLTAGERIGLYKSAQSIYEEPANMYTPPIHASERKSHEKLPMLNQSRSM